MIKRKWGIVCGFIVIIVFSSVTVGPVMSNVELPKYKVISSDNNIEIRRYNPIIIAEVEVKGEREGAIKSGFRLLAVYIFGNNAAQRNIAMTAPVQQQASLHGWHVSFVMPSEYSTENLPLPNNHQVVIKEIQEKMYVVIKFSGLNSNKNISKHEKRLNQYVEANQLQVTDSPIYAFYNPPWTLPFMRRNEVMIELYKKK